MVMQIVEPATISQGGTTDRREDRLGFAEFASQRRRLEPRSLKTQGTRAQTLPSATPRSLIIGTLPDARLRLVRPILAEVFGDGGRVGVWSPEFEELGTGKHLSAAVRDFQLSVIELYYSLEKDQQRLGPDLAQLWQRLQDAIALRP